MINTVDENEAKNPKVQYTEAESAENLLLDLATKLMNI